MHQLYFCQADFIAFGEVIRRFVGQIRLSVRTVYHLVCHRPYLLKSTTNKIVSRRSRPLSGSPGSGAQCAARPNLCPMPGGQGHKNKAGTDKRDETTIRLM